MADSKFLRYQDANGDGLIDVCDDIIEVNEEFCPGCIPSPCAVVPIWQNRRKWEPFLNEKICKYQITKGTPRTTTDPEETSDAIDRSTFGEDVGPDRSITPLGGDGTESTSWDLGWLPDEPAAEPGPQTKPSAADSADPNAAPAGQLESIAATDEEAGGLNYKIFDKYADEIIEALLTAYDKYQSENSKNIIKR